MLSSTQPHNELHSATRRGRNQPSHMSLIQQNWVRGIADSSSRYPKHYRYNSIINDNITVIIRLFFRLYTVQLYLESICGLQLCKRFTLWLNAGSTFLVSTSVIDKSFYFHVFLFQRLTTLPQCFSTANCICGNWAAFDSRSQLIIPNLQQEKTKKTFPLL